MATTKSWKMEITVPLFPAVVLCQDYVTYYYYHFAFQHIVLPECEGTGM